MAHTASDPWDIAEPAKTRKKLPAIALFSLLLLVFALAGEQPVIASPSCSGDMLALQNEPLLPVIG